MNRPGSRQKGQISLLSPIPRGLQLALDTRVSVRFLVAARALAEMVGEEHLASGSIYPPLTHIRDISLTIATAVAEQAYAQGLARQPRPDDVRQAIAASMYDPSY